jgi:hypothetical protein
MVQNIDTLPLFVSDQGVPYWLFIHKCQEKEKIAELIQKFKRFYKWIGTEKKTYAFI